MFVIWLKMTTISGKDMNTNSQIRHTNYLLPWKAFGYHHVDINSKRTILLFENMKCKHMGTPIPIN